MEILIIDDDPGLRAVLVSIVLDACAVEPRTFCDGDLALRYLEHSKADLRPLLAFVDVQMPTVDGMTVVKALKSRHPRSFAVVMSANRAYRELAYQAGADHFLHKPFELDEMLRVIDRWSAGELQEGAPRELGSSCIVALREDATSRAHFRWAVPQQPLPL